MKMTIRDWFYQYYYGPERLIGELYHQNYRVQGFSTTKKRETIQVNYAFGTVPWPQVEVSLDDEVEIRPNLDAAQQLIAEMLVCLTTKGPTDQVTEIIRRARAFLQDLAEATP